jgi:hypothetical protein
MDDEAELDPELDVDVDADAELEPELELELTLFLDELLDCRLLGGARSIEPSDT